MSQHIVPISPEAAQMSDAALRWALEPSGYEDAVGNLAAAQVVLGAAIEQRAKSDFDIRVVAQQAALNRATGLVALSRVVQPKSTMELGLGQLRTTLQSFDTAFNATLPIASGRESAQVPGALRPSVVPRLLMSEHGLNLAANGLEVVVNQTLMKRLNLPGARQHHFQLGMAWNYVRHNPGNREAAAIIAHIGTTASAIYAHGRNPVYGGMWRLRSVGHGRPRSAEGRLVTHISDMLLERAGI